MARVLLLVTGVVAAVVGAVLLVTGGVFAAVFGPDDRITSVPARAAGDGVALLLPSLAVEPVGLPVPDSVGTLTLTAASSADVPIFVGVALPDDLDAYLEGAPYDVVVEDLPADGAAQTRPVPGTQQPAPPATQQFWVRQASGTSATVPARIPDGTALVVMNDDAAPGVAVELEATLEVRNGWTAALVAIGAGLVLLVLGGFLIRAGARRRPRGTHTHEAVPEARLESRSGADVVPGSPPPAAPDAADGLASPSHDGG